MKIIAKLPLMLILFFFNINFLLAQDSTISANYKEDAIQKLSELMNDYYVFPEIAKATETHLKKQYKAGFFNQFDNNKSFAEALTKSVQSINKDKHMRIRVNRPFVAPSNSPERLIEERLTQMDRSRRQNYGFNTAQVLEGNVGYLDLRGFAGLENAKATADAAMKLLSRTDAVIFDLSKNGGGSPRMVQYLCSFFFDQKVHLNSLYWREGDRTDEFWTLNDVGGKKMADVPLFIITSNRTFSAAEEFSYNMQTQKRATLVGQTSGGGANPGGTRPINEKLSVFIPTGKAVNPITNTNWEGVGVIPEVEVVQENVFEKAHELAKEAAEAFRKQTKSQNKAIFGALNTSLEHYNPNTSGNSIVKELKACISAGIMDESTINTLGYNYLMQQNNPIKAQAIFKANTQLFPESANVFDSYAESLMLAGDLKASLKNYEKAVQIALENENRDIELFQKNLEGIKKRISTHR